MKATGFLLKCQNYFKCFLIFFFGYKMGGGGGGGTYIGYQMYENTRKPNILANTRNKEVIHQNEVGWH